MSSKVYVIGVGMTKFEKPGSRSNFDYPDMAREAGQKALTDAGITYDKIEQAFVGYVYGDSTSGQRAVYELGLTGIPVVNVNNNCSTGSTALYLAKSAIEGGHSHCVLALGFEKMQRGSLTSQYSDRSNPMEKHVEAMSNLYDITGAPMTAQMFGNAGLDYQKKYGFGDDVFAMIAHKNHKHSVNNPYAQFQQEYSLDDIKKSPMISSPLTKLQCSPTSDGSAAAVLVSEEFVRKHKLESKAVQILALEMATDLKDTFSPGTDCTKIVGFEMSKLAATKAFNKAGIRPSDVQVVELHDCFSANELITYEALGLCGVGKAAELVLNKDNTYGGKYVVNPSGGLISKGHPLGATGVAQCAELTWQLRGEAGKRQVSNVKYALQHNIGLGGAAVVGIYTLGFPGSRPSTGAASATTTTGSAGDLTASTSTHKSGRFFEEIQALLKEDQSFITKVGAIIDFTIGLGGDKTISYIVDVKNAPGSVKVNPGGTKSDCKITINDEDLLNILDGKANMMTAFTQKKIKISGNMGVAMKLNQLFTSVLKSRSSSTTPKPSSTTQTSTDDLKASTSKHKSGKFFEEIQARLKEDQSFITKVGAIIDFTIGLGGDKTISYIVDVKNAPGSVKVNPGGIKSECKITINDDDLLNILDGKSNMMTAFTQKKIKISGNMGVAMKLNQLFTSVLKNRSKL